jgi:ubiquinone/menaquinone biosynthesis C-methylase UbiE
MIEASPAYLEAAREEGERRGINERVTYIQGDFLDLEQSVPSADIVTLERVLNVYPTGRSSRAIQHGTLSAFTALLCRARDSS